MTGDHPDPATLHAYAAGRLPTELARSLDEHISQCDECVSRMDRVKSDHILKLLRDRPLTPQPPLPQRGEGEIILKNHPRYKIRGILGAGGMGVVYRATHRMMDRDVALKLIRPQLLASPEAVERFRNEVRLAATLAHPNIVAAYDAEEIDGTYVLVMEYVRGKTLDAYVRRKGPLALDIACKLIRQAALGLEHAHKLGLIHRDIKPLNLITTERGHVKILDFGLARWVEPSNDTQLTRDNQTLGTMLYASPEQRSGRALDARTDQYGLGRSLAFLLLGDDPTQLHVELPGFPPEFQAVVSKLTAERPEDRFENMTEVIRSLSSWTGKNATPVPMNRPWKRIGIIGLTLFIILTIFTIIVNPFQRAAPPVAHVTPTTQSDPRTQNWQSLLNFPIRENAVAGTWNRDSNGLRVSPSEAARITVPGELPTEYDLRVSFTRNSGSQSVGVIFVQNGQQAVFELDAWNLHLGGFQNINGQSLQHNRTRTKNVGLTNGRRYTVLVEVRRDSIRGYLDKREIAFHRTDGTDLSIDPNTWPLPRRTLGLVAWNCEVVFHSVEILEK